MSLPKLAQTLVKRSASLKDRAISTILNEINKLKGTCPNKSKLAELIVKRNQVVESLNSLKTTINIINSVVDPIDLIISPLTTAISTIKILPIPVASPPVPGLTIGTIVTTGDVLDGIQALLEKFNNQLDSFDSILSYLTSTIDEIIAQLALLDLLINKCKSETGLDTPLLSVDPELLQQVQQIKDSKQSVLDLAYKGFTFEIIEDDNLNLSIPRRYAVAKNPQGIILLKTDPSFTNDPNILVEELKFLIDSNGLIAN